MIADRYTALFSALLSRLIALACGSTWVTSFIARFWISIEVVYLQRWHGWCHMKLLSCRRVLCTPYNHAPCYFMQSHIRKVYACLAVTYHLHFWQNDRDLLRATAVTRGWNGYRNMSTESRSWRRKFSRRSCRDSNPRPFNDESGTLTTEPSSPSHDHWRQQPRGDNGNLTTRGSRFARWAKSVKSVESLNSHCCHETVHCQWPFLTELRHPIRRFFNLFFWFFSSSAVPFWTCIYICKSMACAVSEFRSCAKVKVDVLGSPSLIVLTVSVDVKQHWTVVSQSSELCTMSRWTSWSPRP